MKVCTQCEESKLVDDFYFSHTNKAGEIFYKQKCRKCICENEKRKRASNPKEKKSKKQYLKCDHCDSTGHRNKLSGMALCVKHALQYKRHGKILVNTRFETNDYTISECGTFAVINLRDRNANKVGETIVDIEDLDISIENRLHMKVSHKNKENPLYYAIAKVNDKNIRLHTIIMNDKNVDHIDNDGLNNRKENLRKTTHSKNLMNQRTQARSVSGVTGVNWSKRNRTWHANIKKNGKQIRLSCCQSTFDNAVKTRIIGEVKYFREFSNNYNHDTNTLQLAYLSLDDNKETYIEVDMECNVVEFKKDL